MIDVMGIDHVGCGFDFFEFIDNPDTMGTMTDTGSPCTKGLANASEIPNIFACFEKMGMSKEEIKILLVDDEKQFVDTLAERLAMRGFSARVAYDGPQALKAVEEPTDVIVLDLRMPGMDGFEVLRSVKKSNPQVQVIILTGHGGDAEEQTAYRMGAYNFLKKPMDIDELLNSIRMAYRDKVENAMVAVSLAEGGDFDAAQDVLNEKDLLAEHKL